MCNVLITIINHCMNIARPIYSLDMNYEELLRNIGKSGLTIRDFAELLGMNRVSISNLSKKEEVPVHLGVIAALMGEMAEHGIDFRPVIVKMDIKPRPAKGIAAKGVFGGTKRKSTSAVDGRK